MGSRIRQARNTERSLANSKNVYSITEAHPDAVRDSPLHSAQMGNTINAISVVMPLEMHRFHHEMAECVAQNESVLPTWKRK